MTHKEQVEKKIRELCPELQELSFGCEVKLDNSSESVCKIINMGTDGYGNEWKTLLDENDLITTDDMYGSITKIIGSPIELRHILRAIPNSERIRIATDGTFCGSVSGDMGYSYNLTLPFTDQDPALYEFLHNILCGKE